MAREAILLTVEDMIANSKAIEQIKNPSYLVYAKNTEYQYIDNWFVIDVDLFEFSGKQQRIDNRVQESPAQYGQSN